MSVTQERGTPGHGTARWSRVNETWRPTSDGGASEAMSWMRTLVWSLLVFEGLAFGSMAAQPATGEAVPLSGTVESRRGDTVQVAFEPHATVGPAVGDRVVFTHVPENAGGVEARAEGTVAAVGDGTVGVAVTLGRPGFDSTVVIHATGAASVPQPPPGFRRVLVDQYAATADDPFPCQRYEVDVPVAVEIESRPSSLCEIRLDGLRSTVFRLERHFGTIDRDDSIRRDLLAAHQEAAWRESSLPVRGSFTERVPNSQFTVLWSDRAVNGRARCFASAWRRNDIGPPLGPQVNLRATCHAGDDLYFDIRLITLRDQWPAVESDVLQTVGSLRVLPQAR